MLSAAENWLNLEVSGLKRPLTWTSCFHSGPPGGLVRPGLPDLLDRARCGQGSAELLAPPFPSRLSWVGKGRSDAESKDGDAGSSRGVLGKGVGFLGTEMRCRCGVARRRACVTPASRGRLGVIAAGLGRPA